MGAQTAHDRNQGGDPVPADRLLPKRDKFALIAFRRTGAELLLPPNFECRTGFCTAPGVARRGKTPARSGPPGAYNLIRRLSNKDPHNPLRVVVISDGRANQSMTDLSAKEEVTRCARPLLELKTLITGGRHRRQIGFHARRSRCRPCVFVGSKLLHHDRP